MTITRENMKIYFEDGTDTMSIIVAEHEEKIYIPIEVKMAAKNTGKEYSKLYEVYKFMFPTYKEVIIW